MISVRVILASLLALCLSACGSFTYDGTPPGQLKGQLLVIWVGEDKFVYWPRTNDPLTFTLGPDLQQKLGVQTIRPGLMYTDGGSIPRPLRALDGFSPWGYAPAYILHDWAFHAHYCNVEEVPHDPKDAMEYEKISRFQFEDSAALLAEVMKTLMINNRVTTNSEAFNLISFGVDSVVARNLWNSTAADLCDPVSPEHQAMIEDALRQKSLRGLLSGAGSPGKPPLIVHTQMF